MSNATVTNENTEVPSNVTFQVMHSKYDSVLREGSITGDALKKLNGNVDIFDLETIFDELRPAIEAAADKYWLSHPGKTAIVLDIGDV